MIEIGFRVLVDPAMGLFSGRKQPRASGGSDYDGNADRDSQTPVVTACRTVDADTPPRKKQRVRHGARVAWTNFAAEEGDF
jgi:hypothetical protein